MIYIIVGIVGIIGIYCALKIGQAGAYVDAVLDRIYMEERVKRDGMSVQAIEIFDKTGV